MGSADKISIINFECATLSWKKPLSEKAAALAADLRHQGSSVPATRACAGGHPSPTIAASHPRSSAITKTPLKPFTGFRTASALLNSIHG
jgi:hypothetical protein